MKGFCLLFAATIAASLLCSCSEAEKSQPSNDAIERFVGVAVFADGVCSEKEEKAIAETAKHYSIDKMEFMAALQSVREAMDTIPESKYDGFLSEIDVNIQEHGEELFDKALDIAVCDKEVNGQESRRLLDIAKVLGFKPEDATLKIAEKSNQKGAKIKH